MKKFLLAFLVTISCVHVFAHHTKGGWMYYQYLGRGVNDTTKLLYRIVLKEYMIINPGPGQLDAQINLTLFDGNNNYIENISVPLHDTIHLQNCTMAACNPCISPIPTVSYTIATYETTKELSPSVNGYTFSFQRCCRIDGLANVPSDGTNVGDTWTISIPGTKNIASGPQNSSPLFPINDTTIICAHNFFTYKFEATDSDGDSLSYSFTTAYDGAAPPSLPNPGTAASPPYVSVPYTLPYSAFQPLGSAVTIDPRTGLVSGIAPDVGEYVIAVLVIEYRNGVFFASSRKSLHIQVASCSPVTVALNPVYTFCDNYTGSFSNRFPTPAGTIYSWNFGDPGSGAQNTSSLATPTHTYSDTGVFKLKVSVSLNGKCTNTDSSVVRVFPGFFPGFTTLGQCKNTQIQFTDTTKTTYGVVNSWSWNFGDPATLADTSHLKNPKYIYSIAGNYDVTFYVTNSKGCSDTITKSIIITDKPSLQVTNDTLICSIDTLQLNAIGNGSFLWTPNYNINNQSSAAPLVSPKSPTTYYVTLTDPFGCQANDSVYVNVKQYVTVDAGPDLNLCGGDTGKIQTSSDALHYTWNPSNYLLTDTSKQPLAFPPTTTKYYVIANIGKCQSTDSLTIHVTPYPVKTPKLDTLICYGETIQLHATGGSVYQWSPPFFLNSTTIPDPFANPTRNIQYVVAISDTLGCTKSVSDTIIIHVDRVFADAGPRDTSVVINQPLQFNGSGSQFYLWDPAGWLNNPSIPNPIGIFNIPGSFQFVLTTSNSVGCSATDTITVHVYKVTPGLYIPNAFTPNGNGVNDIFKPVAIGIKQVNYFKVFNRWGQLVYSSTDHSQGWDGTFKGKPQDAGVYVWIVEAVDYSDNKITQKGIVTLIR